MSEPVIRQGVARSPFSGSERSRRLAQTLAIPLAVLLGAILVVLSAFDTSIAIDGASMRPLLRNGDRLLVTRGYERFVRGDVVVLHPPGSSRLDPSSYLVKRIIALAGDEIAVVDGHAYVNGQIEQGTYTVLVADRDIDVTRTTVPAGTVYILGDNRPVSEDSRVFGPVPKDHVLGRVSAIYAPIHRIALVD